MILTEAHDYMDLLLDKADQPYFTTEEKNKFLNIAISDFINFHYQKMTADEDSRRALAGCIDWHAFTLTKAEIISGLYVYVNATTPGINDYPAMSEKYGDNWANDHSGYFTYGNQYVVPKQHLYILAIAVSYYNKDEIIDPLTGLPYTGVVEDDIVVTPAVSVKNKSTRNYMEDAYSNDPFNKSSKDAPYWSYIENRIIFADSSEIRYINMQTITLPTVDQAFTGDTYDASTAPVARSFAEHYQKQIVQMAVEKMTKVDVGLMTPPS